MALKKGCFPSSLILDVSKTRILKPAVRFPFSSFSNSDLFIFTLPVEP